MSRKCRKCGGKVSKNQKPWEQWCEECKKKHYLKNAKSCKFFGSCDRTRNMCDDEQCWYCNIELNRGFVFKD